MLSDHRYTAIFGAALLTAGGATFAVYRVLSAVGTPRHEPVRAVVVAVRDVPVGVPVPREALGVASWPVRVAPAESYASLDSVVGRVTRVPLTSGEPVLTNRLALRGAAPGLEGAIDPTRRAMAVRVNEAASVSGLVRANSRVDVLVAGRADGSTGQTTARVLMSDVRVLGVGSVRPPEPTGSSSTPEPPPSATTAAIVTLEVTPTQAEELAAAESQGAIQVVLRGYGTAGSAVLAGPLPTAADSPPLAFGGPLPPSGRSHASGPSLVSSPPAPSVRRVATVAAASASRRTEKRVGDAPRADSTVVHVYRGGVMTVLRVEATPSLPAAAGEASARPLHTADARTGPNAP